MMSTKAHSDARAITLALGGEWRGTYGSAPCPVCQPERRPDQRGLSIRSEGSQFLAYCHKTGCGFRDIVKAAGLAPEAMTIHPDEACKADVQRDAYAAEQLGKARKLWALGSPIRGTKGEIYLRGRGITCHLPSSLRWAADTFHGPSGQWLSAMVADVSKGGVHRTFFDKSGCRIGGNAKMMLGPCSGGAVALSGAHELLVVCEGIETGLSLLSGPLGEPATVWAALSTSGVRALDLPPTPGRLILAPDSDAPGMAAAEVLGNRAYAMGWRVFMMAPPKGKDWNDVLQSGVAE